MSSNSRPDASGQATRLLTVAMIVIALAAVGAYQQVNQASDTDRSVQDTVERFTRLPLQIEGWTGTDTTIDAKQLRVSEAQACMSRVYTKNGQSVAVLVLFGEPGPLGAHTPEICYGASGHQQIGQPFRDTETGGNGTLWTARFESPGTPPSQIEVTWGWGTDGTWSASATPRMEFAGHSRIYKVYVSRRITTLATGPNPNEFLTPFLRALRTVLSDPLTPKH